MQVLDAQYIDKPSQLPSSVFSTVTIILPSQHPTLSPSGLPTDILLISPQKIPSRDPTKSPSKKPSWFSIFFQVQTPALKHQRSLVQCPLCYKAWRQL